MKWNKTYPDRDITKDYFIAPNDLFYLGLNCREISLYCYLMSIEDHKTYESYCKMNTIAKLLDFKSRNTVAKTINSLVEKRLLTAENTKVRSKNGRIQNGCLRFHIRPLEEAIRYYHEHEIERIEKERAEQKLKKAVEKVNSRRRPKERHPC